MIITIGGNIGAGKTTLAAKLAPALGYEELYMGSIFRAMAAEKGLSIEEFYSALASDPSTEREADARQAELMRAKDNLIVQGRVSWHFVKESPFPTFNIFLKVAPAVGAARSGQRPENAGKAIETMIAADAQRERDERERYRMLYGIDDHLDPKHYDFVLDTSDLGEQEAFDRVMEEIRARLSA